MDVLQSWHTIEAQHDVQDIGNGLDYSRNSLNKTKQAECTKNLDVV